MVTHRVGAHLVEYALGTPWAILPDTLGFLLRVIHRDYSEEEAAAVAARLGIPLDNARAVTVRDGVATIPVSGPMFRYANLLTEISGATSYAVLATDLTAALDDDAVKGILLAVDSPGGDVNGVSDLAQLICAARERKPIVAHIGGFGASAAFWLATAAHQVVVSDTALVGSIGVVMSAVHDDPETAERHIEFVSSQTPDKLIDASTKSGRARYQAIVDQLAGVFVAAVARHRKTDEATVLADYGRGGILIGQSAVAAGMADHVATFEETHTMLAETVGVRSSTAPSLAAVLPRLAALQHADRQWLAASCDLRGLTVHLPPAVSARRNNPILSLSPAPRATAETVSMPTPTHPPVAPATVTPASPDLLGEYKAYVAEVSTLCDLAGFPGLAASLIRAETPLDAIREDLTKRVAARDAARLVPPTPVVTGVTDRELAEPFASLGEQCMLIRAAAVTPSSIDRRLLQTHDRIKAATGMSGVVDSEGGFFLAPTFSDRLLERTYSTGQILPRVTRTPIGPNSNALTINGVDETSRATGSRQGGIRGYWINTPDGEAITASKPKWTQIGLKLQGLGAAVYATEDELEDVVALNARLNRAVPIELNFMLEDALFNGTGAGMPKGILQAGCLISVAKETGQQANTVTVENIVTMYARSWGAGRTGAVWHINQDIEPQLFTMGITFGTGGQAIYMPPGGLSAAPFATLLGLPVIPVEYCETLGTVGDIVLAQWGAYEMITKGGVKAAESISVKFLENERTFRFTLRTDGQPSWRVALTPFKGTVTQSPYVALATRA